MSAKNKARVRLGIRARDLFGNGRRDYVCYDCLVIVPGPDHCPLCEKKAHQEQDKKAAFAAFCQRTKAEQAARDAACF